MNGKCKRGIDRCKRRQVGSNPRVNQRKWCMWLDRQSGKDYGHSGSQKERWGYAKRIIYQSESLGQVSRVAAPDMAWVAAGLWVGKTMCLLTGSMETDRLRMDRVQGAREMVSCCIA